ncbi:hypothetical protein B0H19DRAFT_1184371 [Mycena capillaripes]|nr:hypothetical protein B0H19DRAFT_1184371 [Mycena capillaripes]
MRAAWPAVALHADTWPGNPFHGDDWRGTASPDIYNAALTSRTFQVQVWYYRTWLTTSSFTQ